MTEVYENKPNENGYEPNENGYEPCVGYVWFYK